MMKANVAGRLRNTQLGRDRALLPAFEVVVNSFQAIEETGEPATNHSIEIVIGRDAVLHGLEDRQGQIDSIVVTDTGVGFNEANLESFFTSDSLYKSNRGGKGIGRFMWLKAFDHAEIDSHFRDGASLVQRVFTFTSDSEKPDSPPTASSAASPRTTVRLIGMKAAYREHCPQGLQLIAHLLIEHCLPFFVDPECPHVRIQDDSGQLDVNDHFRRTFAANATNHSFAVGGNNFRLMGLRLLHPHHDHRLLFAANYREVMAEKLDKHIPNLRQTRLDDSDGNKFVYLGFVQGEYLDTHVNNERTQFTFPLDSSHDTLGVFTATLDSIRDAACGCASTDLRQFLDDINTTKRDAIVAYVNNEGPEYRSMLRYLGEFIDKIPPGSSSRSLDLALHEQMQEKQKALKQEGCALMDESDKQSLTPDDYHAKLDSFLERANEIGKSSLARYVAHRRVMLGFLEKSLQVNPDTGKYDLEKVIHKIIYPMRATSNDVPYEQQNLWIIDERLAYHGFLASDMALDDLGLFSTPSKDRPDLMIFDRALSFSEDTDLLNSLVVVEFKKPDRARFQGEDPVDQVFRLIREIKGGHFKGPQGREIKVASEKIPAYAYVICDTTGAIDQICENKSMHRTPDNLGWYVFNPSLAAYVEVISYTKLLRDAKKRNHVLFEKLNLPTDALS
jgi:hypothetical protein